MTYSLATEETMRLCHTYKVREYRDENVHLIFADDAFIPEDPVLLVEPGAEPSEREMLR